MRVLFATAELAPIARVGGMAEAATGLIKQLRADGVEVTVVLPDYQDHPLENETVIDLDLPDWAGWGRARTGTSDGVGEVSLVSVPGIQKPHPYTDESGAGFADNDRRFFGFSAAVASIVTLVKPDVLHLNDWHTAAALGFLRDPPPSVLTIHTLGYQGITSAMWMDVLPNWPHLFAWYGGTNPLLGGIRLADRVITVSPNYAREILSEQDGMGLHEHLAARGDDLVGIVNGIDVEEWNPATDELVESTFTVKDLSGKAKNRARLLEAFGLDPTVTDQPVIGMVTRLVEQKGLDIAVDAARFLANLPGQLVVLGSGDAHLVWMLERLSAEHPDRIAFRNGYDIALAHLVFAGADMLLMPSRFEPCGLAQMQAMAYGTIPLVTDVGGLHDTVIDDDLNPGDGTGFVSQSVDTAGIVDVLFRAHRAWSEPPRRAGLLRRAMSSDWSWAGPAREYEQIYEDLAGRQA